MTDQYLTPLKVQWRSEHRYLAKEKQRIEARMKELEEMLESFFGETDGLSPYGSSQQVVSPVPASIPVAETGK